MRHGIQVHGHNDKPFFCTYYGCERGIPGNGFPRQWNLRDHMKLVHDIPFPGKAEAMPLSGETVEGGKAAQLVGKPAEKPKTAPMSHAAGVSKNLGVYDNMRDAKA